MPFTRSTKMRRRPTGRRPRRRRPTRVRRYMTPGTVKRIIDAELKLNDLNVRQINVAATVGLVRHLSNIAQGDTNEERQGNWVKPISLMGTVLVQGDDSGNAVDSMSQFRIAVVVWKENQDVDAITVAKVFQSVVNPFQQFNVESKGSFKVLWSWVGNVVNQADNAQLMKMRRFYVKPSMKILFDDAAFRKYHLFLLMISDTPAGDGVPAISFDTRLRYTDS